MRRKPSLKGQPFLDALDRRILAQVQRDCSMSAIRLAELCGTTETTALRRLKRLHRDGVIRGEVALVDGQKVGRGILLFVSVRLEREDGDSAKALLDRILEHASVMQMYFVTGSADYIIMLSLRSMEDYDAFLQEHLVPNPVVIMSDANVVIKPLKMSLAIPFE
jgi:Lrp/AsnC family transcriptional regulator, leucine-responsive regulatory protein